MLRTISRTAIATMTMPPNPTHPKVMAAAPTSLLIVPYPMFWTIVVTATDAVCCHTIETNASSEARMVAASVNK